MPYNNGQKERALARLVVPFVVLIAFAHDKGGREPPCEHGEHERGGGEREERAGDAHAAQRFGQSVHARLRPRAKKTGLSIKRRWCSKRTISSDQ